MTGRGTSIRRVAAGAVALAAIAVLMASTAYRVTYGTFFGDPERIAWCGREYHPGSTGPVALTDIDAPYPLEPVARVPPRMGRTVLAAVTPQATRQRLGTPCTMTLWLRTGDDEYRSYDLSGGP